MTERIKIGLLDPKEKTAAVISEVEGFTEVAAWMDEWEQDHRGLIPVGFIGRRIETKPLQVVG